MKSKQELVIIIVGLFYATALACQVLVLTSKESNLPKAKIVYFRSKTVDTRRVSLPSVVATTYYCTKEQCDNSPYVTASGFEIDHDCPYNSRCLAISRDLKQYFRFGDTVIVSGNRMPTDVDSVWIVRDVMNKRFTKRIDFCFSKGQQGGKFDNLTIKHK